MSSPLLSSVLQLAFAIAKGYALCCCVVFMVQVAAFLILKTVFNKTVDTFLLSDLLIQAFWFAVVLFAVAALSIKLHGRKS